MSDPKNLIEYAEWLEALCAAHGISDRSTLESMLANHFEMKKPRPAGPLFPERMFVMRRLASTQWKIDMDIVKQKWDKKNKKP